MKRKTGARGLRTILESVLLDTMYDLPSSITAKKVVLDEAVVVGETKPYVIHESDEPPTVNMEQPRLAGCPFFAWVNGAASDTLTGRWAHGCAIPVRVLCFD
jgi:hypothetical protein